MGFNSGFKGLSITPRRRIEGLDTKLHTFLIPAEWPISRFGYFTHGKRDSAIS